MPKVGNKKYPYTKKGKAAAKKAAKKKEKRLDTNQREEYGYKRKRKLERRL